MKNIWSWRRTSGHGASLQGFTNPPPPSPVPVTSCPGAVVSVVFTPNGTILGLRGAGAGAEEGGR